MNNFMIEHKVLYYFAYGSNMNPERMIERNVGFSQRRRAMLKGFKLKFNKVSERNPNEGFANIVHDHNELVEGVLYKIMKSDLPKLDLVEGYPSHYDRFKLGIELDNGKKVKAEVYIAQPDYVRDGMKPSRSYMEHLLAGKDIISDRYYRILGAFKTLD